MSDSQRQSGGGAALGIGTARALEMYDTGVGHMLSGGLQEAVLAFQESSFFAPENANPLAALAECYVFLCDLQSAVRYYRRALWVLTTRARLQAKAKAKEQEQLLLYSFGVSSPIPDTSRTPAREPVGISVPTSSNAVEQQEEGIRVPKPDMNGRTSNEAFSNDSGIDTAAVKQRLIGLLDGLSLVLFNMSDFTQALRYAKDALELCPDGHNAAIELHKCVYLIALDREEEAEFQLEAHKELYPDYVVQSCSLLIQLYCNRQAFRPARMLLEELVSHVRYESSLTIAKHVYLEKYQRYRRNALEKIDLGTISKCIEVDPGDVELLFTRARILIDAGDAKKSVKDLFRCIKETNGTHKEAVETMTSVLFSIGSNLDGESGLQEAVSYYSESLKWRSDNVLVLLARGDCYVKLEDFENALQDYRCILNINPDDPVASSRVAFLHDVWGRKLHSLGKVKEAEREFTNAIKTCDREPLFYYHRALCRFQLNEPRYGLRDVLSCQQLQPADQHIRAFIHRYLGTLEDVPETTKVGKERRGKHGQLPRILPGKEDDDRAQVSRDHAPRSFKPVANRAVALYGRPSARIAKVLLDVQDDAEAVGENSGGSAAAAARASVKQYYSKEELGKCMSGPIGPAHTTFKDFVESNAPADELSMITGARTRLHTRNGTGPVATLAIGNDIGRKAKRAAEVSQS